MNTTLDLPKIIELHRKYLAREPDGKRADLSGADLSGAYLRDAYLRDANLNGADLVGAVGIVAIGPIGSRADFLYAVKHAKCTMVKAGCWWSTLDEFAERVEKVHGDNEYGREYKAAVEFVKIVMGGK